jgi:hypothetical protein
MPLCLPPLPAWALSLPHRRQTGKLTSRDRLWLDPGYVMRRAGMQPDPWQLDVLASNELRFLLLCSRQVGKTVTAVALALRTAFLEAPALILVTAPSERQSAEFVRGVQSLYGAMQAARILASGVLTLHDKRIAEAGKDDFYLTLPEKERESALQLHLSNGSRIIGLPASERRIRCFSGVNLLVIDEASRVPDDLYRAVRPMLTVSRGRMVALSTPFGKRGWFFEEWQGRNDWRRVRVEAHKCPRIPGRFLEEERRSLGERWFRQEYECSFEDTIDAVFSYDVIQRALTNDLEPWKVED